MREVIWLGANTLTYPQGGGHLWAYLNWALGLRKAGCEVVWLEHVDPRLPETEAARLIRLLKEKLTPFGFAENIALCSQTEEELPKKLTTDFVPLESARDADLFFNMAYNWFGSILPLFRRTALLDIDPGLLQVWMNDGAVKVPPHHRYFSIGENVGRADAIFPDAGGQWIHTPPCVTLDYWPVTPLRDDAALTTISHWSANEWFSFRGEAFENDKRVGFLPYLELPRKTKLPMELALCLAADEQLNLAPHEVEERDRLVALGWRVVHSHAVSATPEAYHQYIQQSLGEFSCAKPAFVRLQSRWISDRTICYLASGRPAIVEHTGPSEFLPDADGLFRFRNPAEAKRALESIANDYEHHSRRARQLAEEFFSAEKVVPRMLERALD